MSNGGDSVSRGAVYRALRYGFRLLPESVVTALRDFRYSVVSHGVTQTLRWRVDLLTGKYRCSVCRRRVGAFLPLDPATLEELRKYGWKFQKHEAETSNLDSYSCLTSERGRITVQQLGADHFGKDTFRQHGITEQSVLYIVEKNEH
jgi:hypothetical protein